MQTVAALTSTDNLIIRYATLYGEPGYALRTADRRVFFVDHDVQMVQLTNADIPALVLLGDGQTAEQQHLLDMLAGGAARIACERRMEVE